MIASLCVKELKSAMRRRFAWIGAAILLPIIGGRENRSSAEPRDDLGTDMDTLKRNSSPSSQINASEIRSAISVPGPLVRDTQSFRLINSIRDSGLVESRFSGPDFQPKFSNNCCTGELRARWNDDHENRADTLSARG